MTERATATGSDRDAASALWLVELQRVAGRGSHAIKNALNGVAVNLEVVRGRTQRGEAPGSLTLFAESATEQLTCLTMLTEALLMLARPPRVPADVRVTAMALHALLREGPTGRQGLVNRTEYEGPALTSVPGEAVRLAVAHALLPAADDTRPAEWRVEAADTGDGRVLAVRISRHTPAAPWMEEDVETAVLAAGIRIEHGTDTLSLIFPGLAP